MSDDTGGCGMGDSGGGGCDSSFAAPDSSDNRDSGYNDPSPGDSSHNREDYHSNGQSTFNDDAGNISSNTPRWENNDSNTMNSQTEKAEGQQEDCCCTII